MKKRLTNKDKFLIELMVGAARNSELENLHAGTGPSSKTGDYSDVKVVSPYGEIPWNDLSRISDEEMGPLKDSMRKEMSRTILMLKENGLEISWSESSPIQRAFDTVVNGK